MAVNKEPSGNNEPLDRGTVKADFFEARMARFIKQRRTLGQQFRSDNPPHSKLLDYALELTYRDLVALGKGVEAQNLLSSINTPPSSEK